MGSNMKRNKKSPYHNLIILMVIIIVLVIIGTAITMARYRSSGTSEASAEVAIFVLKTGIEEENLLLSGLYPREEAFEYEFTIANIDGEKVAEVSIDYTVELQITTNLPLNIDVYKKTSSDETYSKLTDENDITNEIVLDKSEQCYIRKINIKGGSFTYNEEQTDTYKLSITFPITYSEVEEFEGMVDNVSIIVEAKQK